MNEVKYISTRGGAAARGFADAMLSGLAEDGGLFVPEQWPQIDEESLAALAGRSYEEIAVEVMMPFVCEDFEIGELREHVDAAYSGFGHDARCPLVQYDRNSFLLELFHGPTLAFKDFAMQLVGRLLQAALSRRNCRATIVGATSGDTGSAAIEAFRGMASVDVFILYPDNRVSDIQRLQMTTPPESNVHALAVDGDFDDCQALVKAMFNDAEFRNEMQLAAVNSINWARVLAQTVYYFASAIALGAPGRPVSFSVPTGNFGDIFAGYVARTMGLPIRDLIIATNQNDILHRALNSGSYEIRSVQESISPSMDIQVSSNFERVLFDACGREPGAVIDMMKQLKAGGFRISHGPWDWLRRNFRSGSCSEEETRTTIAATRSGTGMIVCPHTAVGIKVAKEACRESKVPVVALATAHPAKFPQAIKEACGVWPELPARMADIQSRPERICKVANELEAVKRVVRERCAS